MDYCTQSDIEDIFGTQNVAQWSNLDNVTQTADTNRIARALQHATDEINTTFRGGIYAVPLVLNSGAGTVVAWAAKIAGIWMYNNRGQLDTITAADGSTHQYNKYSGMLRDVYTRMKNVKNNIDQIDAARSNVVSTPAVAMGNTSRFGSVRLGCG